MLGERVAHQLEIVVQQFEHLVGRQALVETGEVAQVGEPQDRPDLLAIAAADHAVQDAVAHLAAEVGLGDGLGDALLDVHLRHCAHHVDQAREIVDVGLAEAAFAVGREGHHRQRTVAADVHRQREVIGAAPVLHLMQHFVMPVGEAFEPVANGRTAFPHLLQGAADIGRGELHAIGAGDRLNLLAAPPQEPHRLELRMDELQADIGAPDRDAGFEHAVHQLLEEGIRPPHEPAFPQQPLLHRQQAIGCR